MTKARPHAADDCTAETAQNCGAMEAVEFRPLRARFSAGTAGLQTLEVHVPVPVALALVDLLQRFGVHLTDSRTHIHDGWVQQCFSVVESDGTLVRAERQLELQAEILELLDRNSVQKRPAFGSASVRPARPAAQD